MQIDADAAIGVDLIAAIRGGDLTAVQRLLDQRDDLAQRHS